MNQYQEDLVNCGYIRVDGLTARAYGDKDLEFYIPSPSDYPDKDYLAGMDFIFVFESLSNQTWFKKIDLSDGAFRATLFYHGYELRADGLSDPDKYAVNVHNTAFSLPFTMDEESLQVRKLRPETEFDLHLPEGLISCEMALMQFYGNVSRKVDQFIKYIFSKEDTDLKPLPNKEFADAFGFGFDEKRPLAMNHRHYYMYIILRSWRECKFPYNLTFADFVYMILLPKPPMRFKNG